jgi:hypothetical protein
MVIIFTAPILISTIRERWLVPTSWPLRRAAGHAGRQPPAIATFARKPPIEPPIPMMTFPSPTTAGRTRAAPPWRSLHPLQRASHHAGLYPGHDHVTTPDTTVERHAACSTAVVWHNTAYGGNQHQAGRTSRRAGTHDARRHRATPPARSSSKCIAHPAPRRHHAFAAPVAATWSSSAAIGTPRGAHQAVWRRRYPHP